jgi:hypothetical protein
VHQEYHIDKIRAENVAIGNRARAEYVSHSDAKQAELHAEALYQIRQLIELLPHYSDKINSPHAVMADAESIESALSKKKLNRDRLENLIERVTPAVAGITALANAIAAVQTAITHLFT